MNHCNICNSDYKNKNDHMKSVKHLKVLNQYYCKKCNIFLPLAEKENHLSSNQHTDKNFYCEVCQKYVTDKKSHFQSESHKKKSENVTEITNTFYRENDIVVKEKTYIKYKIYDNFEEEIPKILSQPFFPRFKYQVSYLAKFTKSTNEKEETFNRWIQTDLLHNFDKNDAHAILIEKVDDEELEGSGFQFQYIEEGIIEIYKIKDIKASSYIELPPDYQNSKSVINIKNDDNYCFLWCILAHIFPVEKDKNRVSNYYPYFYSLDITDIYFPMRVKDIPKFERKNNLNINVFELINDTLNPIQINTNYNEKQIDLLLYENHYCLITKLHTLINKTSYATCM